MKINIKPKKTTDITVITRLNMYFFLLRMYIE